MTEDEAAAHMAVLRQTIKQGQAVLEGLLESQRVQLADYLLIELQTFERTPGSESYRLAVADMRVGIARILTDPTARLEAK